MVLSGNTSVSNFSTLSSFRIQKSIGRGYSSQSSQVLGSPSSSHPPSPTLLVFIPFTRLQLHPLPLFPPSLVAPYCPLFRGQPSVAIQKPASVTPVLLAVANAALAHTPYTVLSCHRAPLHPPALLRHADPYSHLLAQADTRHLLDVNFLCQGFIHLLCFYTFCSRCR